MLKFSVGYQCLERDSFADIVRCYARGIEEVYFAWTDAASGRSMIGGYDGYFDYGLQKRLSEELAAIKSLGIRLNLLFNANCYGEEAISRVLEGRVRSVIDFLSENALCPDSVTTTSPFIASIVKNCYQNIRTKASVNMKISTVKGMEYVAHFFDDFCVAKECNRDLDRLAELKRYAEMNEKRIYILANSGCMRDCSGQIFHDNMVAHEQEIAKQKNADFMPYTCWNYLKNPKNFVSVLQNTWIRPEDIQNYEGLVDGVKLATRAQALPGMVIDSYVRGRYYGNLLDLFEPGFGPAFAPYIIDSSKIPSDFFQRTTACDKQCHACGYCAEVLKKSLVLDE